MTAKADFDKQVLRMGVLSLALIRSYDPEAALAIATASGRAHDEQARKLKGNDNGFQRSDDPPGDLGRRGSI